LSTGATGPTSNGPVRPAVPLIGKTGTTDGAKDTWMVGASTKVATVAAVVSVTGDANQRGLSFDSGQAATARHRMWPEVMSVAAAKYGGDGFTEAAPAPVAPPPSAQPAAPGGPSGPGAPGTGGEGGQGGGGPGQGRPRD
jgi:membrane peptidoglycan carboxypeptidase